MVHEAIWHGINEVLEATSVAGKAFVILVYMYRYQHVFT